MLRLVIVGVALPLDVGEVNRGCTDTPDAETVSVTPVFASFSGSVSDGEVDVVESVFFGEISSSHCKDASAVKDVTTVALVNDSNAAAACNNPTAVRISVDVTLLPPTPRTICGTIDKIIIAAAQLTMPLLANADSPTLEVARRTYPPCKRAEKTPISPRRRPF
jgi:hypothetical protein